MTKTRVLMITGLERAEQFASTLGLQLDCDVEVATSRRAGLQSLKRGGFSVVVVEECMVEGDPEWAEQLWEDVGLTIPLQVNFAISGEARLRREVKSALNRRETQYKAARQGAEAEIKSELRGALTGLLLQSELALRESKGLNELEPKLKLMVELAEELRSRFEQPRGGGV